METKICNICLEEKPLSEFTKRGPNSYRAYCKKCKNLKDRLRYATDKNYRDKFKQYREQTKVKERNKEYSKEYRERQSKDARKLRQKRYNLKRNYGLTIEEYNKMLESQQGVCAICGKEEYLTDNKGQTRPLSVDHNHETGEVRGLLCDRCNRGIGIFYEDVDALEKAIQYLTN